MIEIGSPRDDGWQRVSDDGTPLGYVRNSGNGFRWKTRSGAEGICQRRRDALQVLRTFRTSSEIGRPVTNRYRVPAKQWNKWSRVSQRVFNTLYEKMKNQSLFQHSDSVPLPKREWDVIRWNAAWEAACLAASA